MIDDGGWIDCRQAGPYRESMIQPEQLVGAEWAEWYRRVLPPTLRRLRLAFLMVLIMVIIGVWVGVQQVERFPLLFKPDQISNLDRGVHHRARVQTTGYSVRSCLERHIGRRSGGRQSVKPG